jgi:hypothetical protein
MNLYFIYVFFGKPINTFVRTNSKKVGTDTTFSLTNHIAKICFSIRANKFV